MSQVPDPGRTWPLGAFQAFGVELEYMIVQRDTLAVAPQAARVLIDAAGVPAEDIERGPITWSNELVAHVVELKTTGPAAELAGIASRFQGEVVELASRLEPMGLQLLPGGMHPWMDPARETVLWDGETSPVYRAFDRIFGCQGHGWANLQSTHLNLPFGNEAEFVALHGAIRLLLPILPALAASSPVADGALSGALDTRMMHYGRNAASMPQVAGLVVPEHVDSFQDYDRQVLAPLARALASADPDGDLDPEWANARGAIARFGRGSIEIRVLDVQECPAADLALLELIVAVLRQLWEWDSVERISTESLASLLRSVVQVGFAAEVRHPEILMALGLSTDRVLNVREVWSLLADAVAPGLSVDTQAYVEFVLSQGSLAERLCEALGDGGRQRMEQVYRRLGECLVAGDWFRP
jgi:carboxylate-amine ligase